MQRLNLLAQSLESLIRDVIDPLISPGTTPLPDGFATAQLEAAEAKIIDASAIIGGIGFIIQSQPLYHVYRESTPESERMEAIDADAPKV
jgi:hypothetical protein